MARCVRVLCRAAAGEHGGARARGRIPAVYPTLRPTRSRRFDPPSRIGKGFEYIIKNRGIDSEIDYNYTGEDGLIKAKATTDDPHPAELHSFGDGHNHDARSSESR